MSQLSEPLPNATTPYTAVPDGTLTPVRWAWPSAVLALLSIGLMGFCGYMMRVQPLQIGSTQMSSDVQSTTCLRFTGGTCIFLGCKAERNAQCVSGQCVCTQTGMCSGSDGRCKVASNRLIAAGFHIESAKFRGWWVTATTDAVQSSNLGEFRQVIVQQAERSTLGEESAFDLHELTGTPNGQKLYLLSSVKWRSQVLGLDGDPAGPASNNAMALVSMDVKTNTNPWLMGVRVCKRWGATRIGSMRNQWAYVPPFGHVVMGGSSANDYSDFIFDVDLQDLSNC